jgi:hypothetical protein
MTAHARLNTSLEARDGVCVCNGAYPIDAPRNPRGRHDDGAPARRHWRIVAAAPTPRAADGRRRWREFGAGTLPAGRRLNLLR